MTDFYREALDAEAFGHIPSSMSVGPIGAYTAILLVQIDRQWIYERDGLPLPYYGA